MDAIHWTLTGLLSPFNSPFLIVALALLREFGARRGKADTWFWKTAAIVSATWFCAYSSARLSTGVALWLGRMESPLFLVLTLMVMPALFAPPGKWRRLASTPALAALILFPFEVLHQYSLAPSDAGFFWFPARPVFSMAFLVALLVLARPCMSMGAFRKTTRIACCLVLIYGGFALRQSYQDYKELAGRRPDAGVGIVRLTETVPVMRDSTRLQYAPAAPCRFSADGGYVQGCAMELSQRILQTDFQKADAGDPNHSAALAMGLAAIVTLLALAFVGARWWCGWVCPLAGLGDILDALRRWLRIPMFRPSWFQKRLLLFLGMAAAGFTLLLSKAAANLDETGCFLGIRLPIYPFCKICPGQQVCPVAARGVDGATSLPGWDWLFGFFQIAVLCLLALYLLGFAFGRRLWCRLCPMGAVGGIFNRGGMLALVKTPSKCNGCGACSDSCPMDIRHLTENRTDISSYDCLYCMKCVDACPRDGCLSIEVCGAKVAESKFDTKL